ncbi:unnamed protein product [Rangifer tarandus platyrhynchus]|uniref:Uncharacterized protein n=2 Tax=Rangifer tarandus platyrhynchus TaxID=3082113 RepID=A0ABN8YET1_RANTA|nr:unnamed protein product [Rangifer tarandus platyrhynchus]CAI9699884.1 unnamed protein product [Rangifer tarandus platyrhynchus]
MRCLLFASRLARLSSLRAVSEDTKARLVLLQFILFRAAERSGRREETRAHAPRDRLPAGPPHPAFLK